MKFGIKVQSLIREDILEKEMATRSKLLAWEIPRTEEPGWGHSKRLPEVTIGVLSPLGLVGFVVYLKTNPVPGQGKLNKSKQA